MECLLRRLPIPKDGGHPAVGAGIALVGHVGAPKARDADMITPTGTDPAAINAVIVERMIVDIVPPPACVAARLARGPPSRTTLLADDIAATDAVLVEKMIEHVVPPTAYAAISPVRAPVPSNRPLTAFSTPLTSQLRGKGRGSSGKGAGRQRGRGRGTPLVPAMAHSITAARHAATNDHPLTSALPVATSEAAPVGFLVRGVGEESLEGAINGVLSVSPTLSEVSRDWIRLPPDGSGRGVCLMLAHPRFRERDVLVQIMQELRSHAVVGRTTSERTVAIATDHGLVRLSLSRDASNCVAAGTAPPPIPVPLDSTAAPASDLSTLETSTGATEGVETGANAVLMPDPPAAPMPVSSPVEGEAAASASAPTPATEAPEPHPVSSTPVPSATPVVEERAIEPNPAANGNRNISVRVRERDFEVAGVRTLRESRDWQCAVCRADMLVGESVAVTLCMHHIHTECLERWLTRATQPELLYAASEPVVRCPECNANLLALVAP
ncbi:unnamed protein product [Symbiodinium sp. CCMP2456]|nr:unnamed protein product [Symbiodinium sp. CCMP2456]